MWECLNLGLEVRFQMFDLHTSHRLKMAAEPFSTCGSWQQFEEDQRSRKESGENENGDMEPSSKLQNEEPLTFG